MATAAAPAQRNVGHELALLIVLTLGNGIVGFDRQTVAYLTPFIVKEMHLSNGQLGWIASALSAAIAISSFFGSQLADQSGKRKGMLVGCTLLFSLLSGVSGLATSFAFLLAARFALGLSEGPIVPISQAIIVDTSSPKWRGFNMGFMQMVGAFGIAGFVGPRVATVIGAEHGWRTAMFLSIVPGLVVAALMVLVLRRDGPRPAGERTAQSNPFVDFAALLRIRNMRLALAIAGLITGWLVLETTFLTRFLTETKGLTPVAAGAVISWGGIGAFVGGIAFPTLSDWVGRKAVLVLGSLAATLGPLALLTLHDPFALSLAMGLGWLPLGIAPLYCATVPTESVSPSLAVTAVGMAMGFAEFFGGMVVPPIGGYAADALGLQAIFWICIGLALVSAFAALFLTETAPRKVGAPYRIPGES
ncbi:MAG TPA: MFS transporter [Croceibacterium sp.]|jgi:MFS family permease